MSCQSHLHDEVQARLAFQQHLKLEEFKHYETLKIYWKTYEAYQTAANELSQAVADLSDAQSHNLETSKEVAVLRVEREDHQRLETSMAARIEELESLTGVQRVGSTKVYTAADESS